MFRCVRRRWLASGARSSLLRRLRPGHDAGEIGILACFTLRPVAVLLLFSARSLLLLLLLLSLLLLASLRRRVSLHGVPRSSDVSTGRSRRHWAAQARPCPSGRPNRPPTRPPTKPMRSAAA